ncbi:MAG: four helix bundle protein [Candidatus Magasanikiibacteriota bacterium]
MKEGNFHDELKRFIHEYVLLSYIHTKKYPVDERYGLTSQDRRASVSVMLNYVEGFARMKFGVMVNQFEIAYASLKESIYCRFLSKELNYISEEEYKQALILKEKIGKMLYGTIQGIKNKNRL